MATAPQTPGQELKELIFATREDAYEAARQIAQNMGLGTNPGDVTQFWSEPVEATDGTWCITEPEPPGRALPPVAKAGPVVDGKPTIVWEFPTEAVPAMASVAKFTRGPMAKPKKVPPSE